MEITMAGVKRGFAPGLHQSCEVIKEKSKLNIKEKNIQVIPRKNLEGSEVIDDENSDVINEQNSDAIDDDNNEVTNEQSREVIDEQNSDVIDDQSSEIMNGQNREVIDEQNSDVIYGENGKVKPEENSEVKPEEKSKVDPEENINVTARTASSFERLEQSDEFSALVDICLKEIVTPLLRRYIKPVTEGLYNNLVEQHNINIQIIPNILLSYKSFTLQYRWINDNNQVINTIPFNHRTHGPNPNWDYKVGGAVDLTKLFLSRMSRFTDFCDCDLLEVLNILEHIDTFPVQVRQKAAELKNEVRTPVAHYKPNEWNNEKFECSFEKMQNIVNSLDIDADEKRHTVSEIEKKKKRRCILVTEELYCLLTIKQGNNQNSTMITRGLKHEEENRTIKNFPLNTESGSGDFGVKHASKSSVKLDLTADEAVFRTVETFKMAVHKLLDNIIKCSGVKKNECVCLDVEFILPKTLTQEQLDIVSKAFPGALETEKEEQLDIVSKAFPGAPETEKEEKLDIVSKAFPGALETEKEEKLDIVSKAFHGAPETEKEEQFDIVSKAFPGALETEKKANYSLTSQSQVAKVPIKKCKFKTSAFDVVAIDFGTTFSGYAYSFQAEYVQDHAKIYSNTVWRSGEGLQTSKTPTVILFDKDKKFHSFGYEAEDKYCTLQGYGEAGGWRFFRRFKMSLFRENYEGRKIKNISKDLIIEDEQKQPMPALVVISESIRYLKDHFLKCNQISGFKFKPEDVHYVLTIPAIWDDRAKQFMREAAKMADIPDKMLTLAYEPEAAAIFCKELTVQENEGDSSTTSSFDPGQQFLVLDCGGGTIDITAYQIQNDGNLKELERPTGGPWGRTFVDRKYTDFLEELFGKDIWKEFSITNSEDLLEIERKFEAARQNSDNQLTISFPNELFTKFKKGTNCITVEEAFKKSRFADSVKVRKNKLRFECNLFKDIFQEAIDAIVKHLKELFKNSPLRNKDVKTILMVGGFSYCSILSERIKTEFKSKRVICPSDAVDIIMKGAVIFGHNPYIISERISPRTYGISVNRKFKPGVHPTKFKVEYDGKEMCTDIFQIIVQNGHTIPVGEIIFRETVYPTRAFDSEATIEIYESDLDCPMFCTEDGVHRLGELTIPLSDISKGKNRPIEIDVSFGYTELKMTCVEKGTTNDVKGTFNCLLST